MSVYVVNITNCPIIITDNRKNQLWELKLTKHRESWYQNAL